MPHFKTVINEIHRRSLWQVLAIYLATGWLVLQAVDVLTSAYGLPSWFPATAAVILLIGLPFVLATAFVQEGGPSTPRPDPTLLPEPGARAAQPGAAPGGRDAERLRRLLSWRNALLIGASAFALWGIVSAVWLFTGFRGLVVKAEAADFFSARDRVVVADFGNETDQPALGLAVREAVITDLDQSAYVHTVARAELDAILKRMRLPPTATLTEEVATEIARREGYPAVVAGSVTPLGAGYQVTARIIESSTGEVAVRVRETAAGADDVVATVERLSRLLRRHLGESLSSLRRSRPLPQVTTASLEALELFAEGRALMRRGKGAAAIPLLERAVARDTAFASAYRALGMAQGNLGNTAAAQMNVDRAYRHAERLLARERYLTGAAYHSYRGYLDSAAFYYDLLVARDPNEAVALNNLGDLYERMGRYEEALQLYRRAAAFDSSHTVPFYNVASAASTLGRLAAAESALAVLRQVLPQGFPTLTTDFFIALRADDFERAERAARGVAVMAPLYAPWGHLGLAALAALRGHPATALAHADTAVALASETGSPLPVYLTLVMAEQTALATGSLERIRPFLTRTLEQVQSDPSPWFQHLALGFAAEGYALLGEREEARRLLSRADSLVGASGIRPWGSDHRARALLALLENRPEEALDHLRAARATDYGLLFRTGHLLQGDAYAALGRTAEAAAQYDTVAGSHELDFRDVFNYGALKPLGHARASAAYLALGDTVAARRHLARFIELWRDADPELQPRVAAAEQLFARLAGESH